MKRRAEAQISIPPNTIGWDTAFGCSDERVARLSENNVNPIAGIATAGFVAVLGARIRVAGGGDEKRVEA